MKILTRKIFTFSLIIINVITTICIIIAIPKCITKIKDCRQGLKSFGDLAPYQYLRTELSNQILFVIIFVLSLIIIGIFIFLLIKNLINLYNNPHVEIEIEKLKYDRKIAKKKRFENKELIIKNKIERINKKLNQLNKDK